MTTSAESEADLVRKHLEWLVWNYSDLSSRGMWAKRTLALIASQAAEIALINEWRKELEDQNRQLIADIERLRTALRAISRDSLAALGKE